MDEKEAEDDASLAEVAAERDALDSAEPPREGAARLVGAWLTEDGDRVDVDEGLVATIADEDGATRHQLRLDGNDVFRRALPRPGWGKFV